MARYFLDTGALVGVSFLHDLWRNDAERLFETDNTLYTSQAVIYEYCNNDRSNSYSSAEIDWDSEEGRFGEKFAKVRAAQTNLGLKLRTYDDEELDLETLVEAFITETGIDDEIYPQRKIDEYIRPNIRKFLVEEINGREVTCTVAREVMDALCDTIQNEARNTRTRLQQRIKEGPERTGDWSDRKQQLAFIDGGMDREILCDAGHMEDKNLLKKVVTADKNHLYGNRERINAILGLKIIYLKDEFADPSPLEDVERDSVSQDTD